MKKIMFLLFLATGVIGCSVDSLDTNEEMLTADARFKSQSAVTITAPEGDLCAGEVLDFTVDAETGSNFQVQQKDVDGEWQQVHLANKGQEGSASFDVVLLEGENYFRHTNLGSGPNWLEYQTAFIGVDCNPCENLLVAELTCGDLNVLTVTFTAEKAGPIVIQGGLTNGTEIENATSEDLTRNTTNGGVVNSNANVTRWEGDVEACEEVTITIEFKGGDGVGDWTAERGDDVLGETEEEECYPEE